MNQTLYIIIAAVASILVLVATVYAFRHSCRKSGRCLSDYGELDCSKTLGLGATGSEVCLLQEWINRIADNCIPVNGRFGRRTEAALIELTGARFVSLLEIEHPKNPC
ncbi:MAG: hypothetical protein AAFN10_13625 [Bacteroidota bacterium]